MLLGSHTTGILKFAECLFVCRVYSLGHSANKFFAECYPKNTQQKKNTWQKGEFAECQTKNTRQIEDLPSIMKKHSAKGGSPCVLKSTLGKVKK